MASMFRPNVTSYTLPNGKHRDPEGQRVTKNTPGAIKVSKPSPIWYGRYKDAQGAHRKVPLCSDKTASKQMLAKLVTDAKLASHGLGDPFEEHRKRPLVCAACSSVGKADGKACPCPARPHLTDYRRLLESKGNVAGHVYHCRARVGALLSGCRFVWMGDIEPGPVLEWLAAQRGAGMSVSTSNGYLVALRSFTKWLVKDRRMAYDPLAHLSGINAKPYLKHARRALDEAELRRLLIMAGTSTVTFRGITGPDRRILYAMAMGTGLRASELASVHPGAFNLSDSPPVVNVQAAYTKNRKEATQPLPPDLAEALRGYLPGKAANVPVWPGTWNVAAAEMLRIDLKASGIAYRDAMGLVADFHALRHSYVTLLGRSGVSPRLAQELARHSDIRLTMNVYTHTGLYDLAGAVGQLPALTTTKTDSPDVQAMTGTYGRPAEDRSAPGPRRDQTGAPACVNVRHVETSGPDAHMGASAAKSPENAGNKTRCDEVRQPDTKLPGMDSNHDEESQNLLCYRYTTG